MIGKGIGSGYTFMNKKWINPSTFFINKKVLDQTRNIFYIGPEHFISDPETIYIGPEHFISDPETIYYKAREPENIDGSITQYSLLIISYT